MKITREKIAAKLKKYLRHETSLDALVDWAETAMMEGEFEGAHFAAIRDAVARIGVADVRAFGLTWEDCEELLKSPGYAARVEIVAA